MSRLKSEPPAIRSLDELTAVAASLAEEAIARYDAQARRMRQAGAATHLADTHLADTYDELARQQREQVERFLARIPGGAGAPSRAPVVAGLPDDEGTDTAAPELLDPYRVFAVAVRNGERAFAFWSYVAAQAPGPEIGRAAEHLAGEELARAAWLRGRRRASYHAMRRRGDGHPAEPEALERRLAALLEERHAVVADRAAAGDEGLRRELAAFAGQGRKRAAQLGRTPFDASLPSLKRPPVVPIAAWNDALPLCEALLDVYLQLAGEAQNEAERARAHAFASELLVCFGFLRGR